MWRRYPFARQRARRQQRFFRRLLVGAILLLTLVYLLWPSSLPDMPISPSLPPPPSVGAKWNVGTRLRETVEAQLQGVRRSSSFVVLCDIADGDRQCEPLKMDGVTLQTASSSETARTLPPPPRAPFELTWDESAASLTKEWEIDLKQDFLKRHGAGGLDLDIPAPSVEPQSDRDENIRQASPCGSQRLRNWDAVKERRLSSPSQLLRVTVPANLWIISLNQLASVFPLILPSEGFSQSTEKLAELLCNAADATAVVLLPVDGIGTETDDQLLYRAAFLERLVGISLDPPCDIEAFDGAESPGTGWQVLVFRNRTRAQFDSEEPCGDDGPLLDPRLPLLVDDEVPLLSNKAIGLHITKFLRSTSYFATLQGTLRFSTRSGSTVQQENVLLHYSHPIVRRRLAQRIDNSSSQYHSPLLHSNIRCPYLVYYTSCSLQRSTGMEICPIAAGANDKEGGPASSQFQIFEFLELRHKKHSKQITLSEKIELATQISCAINHLEQHPSGFLCVHYSSAFQGIQIVEKDSFVFARLFLPVLVKSVVPSTQPTNNKRRRSARDYQLPCYCSTHGKGMSSLPAPEAIKACDSGETSKLCPATANVWWLAQVFEILARGDGTAVWEHKSAREVKQLLLAGNLPEVSMLGIGSVELHFSALISMMFQEKAPLDAILQHLTVLCKETNCLLPQCEPDTETIFPFRSLLR